MSPTSLPESFTTRAENPYVAAKREWNERYGSYIHQARMWQIMAFLSLGLASISTGYALWIRQNTTYQPFVIAIEDRDAGLRGLPRADRVRRPARHPEPAC